MLSVDKRPEYDMRCICIIHLNALIFTVIKKTDATALMRFLKMEFNPKVAGALNNMRRHFN